VGDVVSLDAQRPHITCGAKCLDCGRTWQAVAPVGVTELECPDCGTLRGTWTHPIAPDTLWQCDCGGQHFYIGYREAHCARCGCAQEFGD